MKQDLETARKERLATERKLDRAMDDVRRARLVEDGLLQSNSETLQYASQYIPLVVTYTNISDR